MVVWPGSQVGGCMARITNHAREFEHVCRSCLKLPGGQEKSRGLFVSLLLTDLWYLGEATGDDAEVAEGLGEGDGLHGLHDVHHSRLY